MDSTFLLTSSVVSAIVASLLNGYWNRRAAKKLPKTEMRAQAYRDLVVYMVSGPHASAERRDEAGRGSLAEIKARVLLLGKSDVVATVSAFFSRHSDLNSENAITDFVDVVREMRKSLLTGHDGDVAEGIRALLQTESVHRSAR